MDAIFFDLDGTLTDPKPGITRSIQYALQRLDHPDDPDRGRTDLVHRAAVAREFCAGCSAAIIRADHAVSLYRERFSDIGLYENGVYNGIGDVLTTLGASGHRLFVATSKPHVFAERIIDHFGLRNHFERVFGAELDGTRVDKSHLLEYALKETSVDPAKTLMIGDRSHDMIGAKNNGMKGNRRAVRVRQPGGIARGRRAPCLRDAGGDPRLHFLKSCACRLDVQDGFQLRLKFGRPLTFPKDVV